MIPNNGREFLNLSDGLSNATNIVINHSEKFVSRLIVSNSPFDELFTYLVEQKLLLIFTFLFLL